MEQPTPVIKERKRNSADYDKTIDIWEMLRLHSTSPKEGLCVYEEGWDDARIANELGASISTVKTIRSRRIGSLDDYQLEEKTINDLEDQITDHEERLEKLEGKLDALDAFYKSTQIRCNAFEDALTLIKSDWKTAIKRRPVDSNIV